MQVTDVVDDEAKGKGPLIALITETLLDFANVVASSGVLTLKECGQICQSAKNIVFGHGEVVVRNVTPLRQVWLGNEVPVALPAVALTLNVVCKSGALSERMVTLVICQTRIRAL